MECIALVADEQVADDGCTQQQRHLEPFVVLHLDAVQVGLHDGHLLEPREEGDGNVGLLALFRLLAREVRRLARHVARHVLAQPALLPPREVDARRVGIGAGVGLRAVEAGAAGHAECDLRQAKLPGDGAAPFGRLLPHKDLRVGVVQLDGELGGVDGLRRGRDAAIPADLVLGQRWLRPAWLRKHFAKEDVGAVRVEQGYGVCVLRIVGGGVDVVEGVLRIGLGAILCEVVGFVVLELVGRRLQEEGYCTLVAPSKSKGVVEQDCVLGRFSSSMVACRFFKNYFAATVLESERILRQRQCCEAARLGIYCTRDTRTVAEA